MELEFEKRGLKVLTPLLREVQAQEVTQELRLPEGMPDLGKILGTWGQAILRGKEWRGDSIACNGGVMVFLLYAPEDGSQVRTMESWIPFQMKWDLPDGHRDGEIRVQLLLRSLDARNLSPRKMMVRCGVSVLVEAIRQDTRMVSQPGQVPEDIQLLKNRYPLRLPKLAGEKTFQQEETLPLSGEPAQLVSYTMTPRLSEVRIMSGKLVIRGSGLVHVLYRTGEGKVESRDLEIPLSQFTELEGEVSPDAQADVRMAVTNLEGELTEDGQLRIKAGLLAQYVVDDREMVEVVSDAYSPSRRVEPVTEELELPAILEQKQVSVPVRQTIRQNARDIADVTYLPDFPNARRGEGMQLELPGLFQVLYYDENGNLAGATARTEENWDMPLGENARVAATVLPGVPATATAGSGIELKGDSVLNLLTTAKGGIPMVTELKLGEENTLDPSRPSLILRRAGNVDLWQIAKSTGSTVSAIRLANGLEKDPEEDQILLIPVS